MLDNNIVKEITHDFSFFNLFEIHFVVYTYTRQKVIVELFIYLMVERMVWPFNIIFCDKKIIYDYFDNQFMSKYIYLMVKKNLS